MHVDRTTNRQEQLTKHAHKSPVKNDIDAKSIGSLSRRETGGNKRLENHSWRPFESQASWKSRSNGRTVTG